MNKHQRHSRVGAERAAALLFCLSRGLAKATRRLKTTQKRRGNGGGGAHAWTCHVVLAKQA